MTTQDFIKKTYGVTSTKERRCSNVFTDRDGNVYSYGYHYPLLFQVMGTWFINTRGYSSTTSKHIGWARQAVDATPIDLDRQAANIISRSYATDIDKLLELARVASEMLDKANANCDAKKRKDTGVYSYLLHNRGIAIQTATVITNLMGV